MKEQRTLRSKKLRQFLFERAGGKCQKCQAELGKEWHADHIVPWSVSKRTNVFEMQVLCPACNLRKARKMEDRRHQAEATDFALAIATGQRTNKEVIADVTPGGGKSRLITNFAKVLLQSNKVSHVIAGCPRKALVSQLEDSFHLSGIKKDQFTVAHYQDIASSCHQVLLHRCKHQRTLFVADELQFLHDFHESKNGLWDSRAQEIYSSAEFFLGVSGTLMSSRPGRLLGVQYRTADELIEKYPDMSLGLKRGQCYPDPDIRYNLRDALHDKVVAPYVIDQVRIKFKPAGLEDELDLFAPESEEYQGLLKEILQSEACWKPVVDAMMEQWKAYRHTHYFSNAIVVAASQQHAQEIERYLQRYHKAEVHVAISDHGDWAYQRIDSIKQKRFDAKPRVLVTVAMASVGLDMPAATHMCYLSPYRFFGWVLQAWARVSRICYDCKIPVPDQLAYIYTVDDLRMQRFVQWVKDQHIKGIRGGDDPPPPPPPPPPPGVDVFLESCRVDGVNFESSEIEAKLFGDEADAVAEIIEADPRVGAFNRKQIALIANATVNARNGKKKTYGHTAQPQVSEKQIKKALRQACNAVQRFITKSVGLDSQEVWVQLKQQSGTSFKGLGDMSLSELRQLLSASLSRASFLDGSIRKFSIKYTSSKNVSDDAKIDEYGDLAELATEEAISLGYDDVRFVTRKQGGF